MPRFFQVGVARRRINPLAGVELAGLGYYLNRTWLRVRDDLTATALVIGDGNTSIAIVALDLMYNDASFTRNIRGQVTAQTDLRPEAICINCSHTHNAPTAGLILGAGQRDAHYHLPDAYDIERRTYAAIQSPKFTGQFPFVKESGQAMVQGMLGALQEVEARR